jgi:hypothetical protein
MAKRREGFYVPFGIPLAAVILLIVGFIARPVIQNAATEEQLNTNVLLSAIPFILIFVAIILFYITLGWIVGSLLNYKIAPRIFKTVESILIVGIVLGVLGMFQPWAFVAYRLGFHVLLVSLLGFMIWSHLVPAGTQRQEQLSTASLSDMAQHEPGAD